MPPSPLPSLLSLTSLAHPAPREPRPSEPARTTPERPTHAVERRGVEPHAVLPLRLEHRLHPRLADQQGGPRPRVGGAEVEEEPAEGVGGREGRPADVDLVGL